MTGPAYTASTALLEGMREAGARYAFANLGSDHTGIMEAFARAASAGSPDSLPELILCPHESVALSAAHGYAQVSGEPQAVIVHVDCGTQNLGGAVHNASRGRVPVLIFAGLSPATQAGSCPAAAPSTSTGCRTARTSAACSAGTPSTTRRSGPAAT